MEQTYKIGLNKETGVLIAFFSKSYWFEGTYEEVVKEFKKVQRHNHIFGWWSGLGPFKVAKFSKANKKSLAEIQEIRRQQGLPV